MKKKLLMFLLCIAIIIPQVGCGSKQPVSKTGFYLDTTCQIDIRDMDASQANKIITGAFSECEKYDNLLSITKEDSDVWKINHSEGNPTEVSSETAEIIKSGLEASKDTDGIYDITVGKLTRLWNFSAEDPKVPNDKDIKAAVKTINYKWVSVSGNTVTVSNPDTWIDLGSIAKGYIADKVASYMKEQGVTSGIVNLGGNIVTIGTKPDGSKWKIGIEMPYSERKEIIGMTNMEDQTLVTSGTYERFIEQDGKKYHHILDPSTGYPVDSDIVGVSILSKEGNSMLCDRYSTICLLLGSKKAEAFIKSKPDFEYVIIDNDNNIIDSKGFNFVKK